MESLPGLLQRLQIRAQWTPFVRHQQNPCPRPPPNTPSPFHRRSADHYHPHSGNLVNFLKRSAFAYGLYTLLSAFKVIVVWNMKLPRTPLYQEIFSIILTKCFHKKHINAFASFFPDGENFPHLKGPTGHTVTRLYAGFRHPDRMAPDQTVRGRENDCSI
jgi:hypothetical protein